MKILLAAVIVIWLYILSVLNRAKLHFFKFMWGSVGLFLLMLIILCPMLNVIIGRGVSVTTGIIGEMLGYYKTFYQESLILVARQEESISMYIDYECSGVVEILAFTSLLWFFPAYNILEKIMNNTIGIIWIFAANVIRILAICTIVYFWGNNAFYFAHTIVGRMIFYLLSIMMYFYMFTRIQVKRQMIGGFHYGNYTQ